MKNNKFIKNKKGFTLIEVLATVIILGVILLVAVPSVTKYIEHSRRNTYVSALKRIVNAVATSVNANEYPNIDKGEALIVPFVYANLEEEVAKNNSPYGKYVIDRSYVVVIFTGRVYEYYVVALDERGYGVPFINSDDLTNSSITNDTSVIDSNIHSLNDIYVSTKDVQDTFKANNITFKAYYSENDIIKVNVL